MKEECNHELSSRVCNSCEVDLIHQAEQEMLKRVVREIEKLPIDWAHTYSSENASDYRIFDDGQKSYKQKVLDLLSILQEPN